MRLVRNPFLITAVLAGLMAGFAFFIGGLGGSGPQPRRPGPNSFGPFAGEQWSDGYVQSMSAEWQVPAVLPGSPTGHSSVWIGAQPEVGSSLNAAPFIQVGTLEDRYDDGNRYVAFWSSTAKRFHPQPLITVNPGDLVRAELSLGTGGWHVELDDLTTFEQSQFTTTEEANGTFTIAEWTEEDPSLDNGDLEPFPDLAPVTFSDMRVDGVAPRASALVPTWMTLPHEQLGPVRGPGGQYTIRPLTLSSAARSFIAIARGEDAASDAFLLELHGSASSPGLRASAQKFAAAVSLSGRQLRAHHWPASARHAVAGLERATSALAARTAAMPRGGKAISRWRVAVLAAAARLGTAARAVHRTLNVPYRIRSGTIPG